MSIYLNIDSMVGKGGYDIQGPKEATDFMEQAIKAVQTKLEVKRRKAIAAITVALAVIGTAYHQEEFLEEFETDSQGVAGIEVRLTFSSVEQMRELFDSVLEIN